MPDAGAAYRIADRKSGGGKAMKTVRLGLLVVLVLLSVATGVTKLIQLPAEMELFANAGWPVWLILAFGVVQVAGGLSLIPKRTRAIGAWVMVATFIVASVVVFLDGRTVFGLVSLLFIALAALPLISDERLGIKAG